MFTQTWKKYLPVIVILMKRSAQGEQVLDMNQLDFQKATGGKKVKLNFANLQLNYGMMNLSEKHAALAYELGQLLQEEEMTKQMIKTRKFEFTMTNNFQLQIRNNTPAEVGE